MQRYRDRNPEKSREALRSWQKRNREKTREYQRKRGRQQREFIRSLKEGKPCMDCGGVFHFSAMDFDHVRGEKILEVGYMASHSRKRILAEIAKCELICANCHRVRTWKRRRGE